MKNLKHGLFRILSSIISVAMISTILALPTFAASNIPDQTVTKQLVSETNEVQKLKKSAIYDVTLDTSIKDITVIAEGLQVKKSNTKIDTSKAQLIDNVLAAQIFELIEGENQAPVAGLQMLVLNPETLVDGQLTTNTIVFLAWLWEGQYYTYDPDGDSIEIHINGIPQSFMQQMTSDDGVTYDGVAIQFQTTGIFSLEYFAADSKVTKSNVINYDFVVMHNEFFDTYACSLTSPEDMAELNISVDYSIYSVYVIAMTEMTTSNSIIVSVTDAQGNTIADSLLEGSRRRNYVELVKPAEGEGVVDYTVKFYANNSLASHFKDTTNILVSVGEKKD